MKHDNITATCVASSRTDVGVRFRLSDETLPESLVEFSRGARITEGDEHIEIGFPWAVCVSALVGTSTLEIENCLTQAWETFRWPDKRARQGVSGDAPALAIGMRVPRFVSNLEVTLDAEVFAIKAFADQWRLDVDTLVAGHPAFRRFQGYRIIRPTATLAALAISRPSGRFGNNFKQLLNAIQLCKHFRLGRLYVPKLSQFAVPESRARIHDLEFVSYRDRREIGESALLGTFFYKSPFEKMLNGGTAHQQKVVDEYVRPLFTPVRNLVQSPAHHIAVHIRSSDLFDRPNPHPRYPQPPLAYYKRVLTHFRETYPEPHVHLVYQDKANPVIDALEGYLRAEGLPFTAHSSTLDEDLRALMCSQTIAFGRGTFGKAVVSLASHVRRIYFPWTDADFRSVVRSKNIEGYMVSEVEPKYVRVGEWANTEAQRRRMIEYPEGNLVLAPYPQ